MIITEIKTVKIDNTCKDYPIYLTWLNSLGGFEYWLFFKKNYGKTQTRNETPFLSNVNDLENDLGNINIIGKSAAPSIDVGAKVLAEDMGGLRGLFESPKVYMLTNNDTWETDGPKWRRVIIKTGSLLYSESNRDRFPIKFTLQLPLKKGQKG